MSTKRASGIWRSKALHVFSASGHKEYSRIEGAPGRISKRLRTLAESGETQTFLIADRGGREHLSLAPTPQPLATTPPVQPKTIWTSLVEFMRGLADRLR